MVSLFEAFPVLPYGALSLDELRVRANDLDCDLVVAGPSDILLDLDVMPSDWDDRIDMLMTRVNDITIERWTSRNGREHARVTLHGVELTLFQRCALEAILGSDWKRELLYFHWSLRTPENAHSVLYKPRSVSEGEPS